MSVILRTLCFTAICITASACQAKPQTAAETITIDNAVMRAVPAGQPNSASFMTFTNTSAQQHILKSATSPVANTVELHTHSNEKGVMAMRQIPQIDLPANTKTELKPGGLHIMLIGLKQPLTLDTTAPLTLTFEDGSSKTLNVPIKMVIPPAMSH